jgi:hypothetical protein
MERELSLDSIGEEDGMGVNDVTCTIPEGLSCLFPILCLEIGDGVWEIWLLGEGRALVRFGLCLG